jgi:hypothetical protein
LMPEAYSSRHGILLIPPTVWHADYWRGMLAPGWQGLRFASRQPRTWRPISSRSSILYKH